MKSILISKEKYNVKFSMEFTAEEFEKGVQDAYLKNRDKFPIDGFRKGKAPRKLIEASHGKDVFFEDAINELFSDGYTEAVKTLDLDPISRPSVDFNAFEEGKPLVATIEVTVKPEFEVKDYKGIKIEKVDRAVTDEELDLELASLVDRNSRMVAVAGPAAIGDTVMLDYAGFVDEDQFEGGTAEGQLLELGSNTFIPGFEEQLVGVAAGEEKDVVVTFPEEYQAEDLKGKKAIFKCKVNEVKQKEAPELNDEFVKDISEFDTLEELKADEKKKLEAKKEEAAINQEKNLMLDKVYEANDIDIPEVMIESQIDRDIEEYDQNLKNQGMSLEIYFQHVDKTMEDFREECKEDSIKKLKTRLLIEAVAEAEKFTVEPEEIDKEIDEMAKLYNMEVEKIKEYMQGENLMYMYQDIKMKKAVNFMFENAIVE